LYGLPEDGYHPPYVEAAKYAHSKLEAGLHGRGLEHAESRKFGMLGTIDLCAYAIFNSAHALRISVIDSNDPKSIEHEMGERNLKHTAEALAMLQRQVGESLNRTMVQGGGQVGVRMAKVREIASNTEKLLRPAIQQFNSLKIPSTKISARAVDLTVADKHWLKGGPGNGFPMSYPPKHIKNQYIRQHKQALKGNFGGAVLRTGMVMPLLGWSPRRPGQQEDTIDYAEVAMWALEAGVRRFSLRGDKYLDFWVGNLLDHGFWLSALGLKRRDIFVSTIQRSLERAKVIDEFWEELKWLRTGYVDLVYLAMPRLQHSQARYEADFKLFVEAYKVIQQISELECPKDECEPDINGKAVRRIQAVGIADAHAEGLHRLLESGIQAPLSVLNKFDVYRQGELLLHRESGLYDLCVRHKIQMETAAPLTGQPFLMRAVEDPHVHQIGKSLSKTPAQVILRWVVQQGFAATFSSHQKGEIMNNAKIFNFQLPDSWMRRISSLQWLVSSPVNIPSVEDIYDVRPMMDLLDDTRNPKSLAGKTKVKEVSKASKKKD